LLDILEQHTKQTFKLKFYDSIPEFEKGFLKGEYDFAYMNPYHAILANETQGYTPLIRDGKRQLIGILLVRQDSDIKTLDDLNGKIIAFPAPTAFGASLYIRALLREKEAINFTPRYAVTHSNSYRQALLKLTAAAGGVYRTFYKERIEVQNNLRVIYETPGKPAHPIVAHRRVTISFRHSVQSALLNLIKTEQGREILSGILIPNPIIANYDKDYRPLKSLKLKKYFVAN